MKTLIFSIAVSLLIAGPVLAGPQGVIKKIDISESDEVRQRGAESVIGACMMCHDLKYLKYEDLRQIGMDDETIQGLMVSESIKDRMMSLSSAEIRKESYGMVPPDLSLIAIARKNGPEYIYSLLTGYYTDADGNEDNHAFPGISMPDILGYSYTEEASEDRVSIEKQAHDIASFLLWAADPNADDRRRIGQYVIAYLIVLTLLLYILKRKIWRNIH